MLGETFYFFYESNSGYLKDDAYNSIILLIAPKVSAMASLLDNVAQNRERPLNIMSYAPIVSVRGNT